MCCTLPIFLCNKIEYKITKIDEPYPTGRIYKLYSGLFQEIVFLLFYYIVY